MNDEERRRKTYYLFPAMAAPAVGGLIYENVQLRTEIKQYESQFKTTEGCEAKGLLVGSNYATGFALGATLLMFGLAKYMNRKRK